MNDMIKNLTTALVLTNALTLIIASALVTPVTAWAQEDSPTPNVPISEASGPTVVDLEVKNYAPGSDPVRFNGSTHIAFGPGSQEIITDLGNNRFVFRESPDVPFQVSPLSVLGQHSVVYNPADKLYYANDTDNHRIISFADLSSGTITAQTKTIAGVTLQRPHDIVLDPATGWIYAINPKSGHVFRFTAIGENESAISVPLQGYARALTLNDGRLYAIGSAKGRIVEIVDWDKPTFKIYDSFDPTGKSGPAGSWTKTGLVLNDAEFFNGFWYATSYFTESYAGGSDSDENKFIRFKTLDDLVTGKWTDLSGLVPSGVTPYYLTVKGGSLYLAIFKHGSSESGDSVLQFTPMQGKTRNQELNLRPDETSVMPRGTADRKSVKVMSYNIYRGGTMRRQPLSQTAKAIQAAKADVVGVQETKSPRGDNMKELAELLGWDHTANILTRYEIVEELENGIKVKLPSGQQAYVFSLHLPSNPYQPYQLLSIQPKWHKHKDTPFLKTEIEAIAAAKEARGRQITRLLRLIRTLPDKEAPVFVVGDFNEPSHLDWTEETARSGRHPMKVQYPNSQAMAKAGFTDAYRKIYPDEMKNPGFTWSPMYKTDDPTTHHDRIDFVYYKGKGVKLNWVKVVGESKENADIVITPYPSDHRAVVAAFTIPIQPKSVDQSTAK